MVSRVEHLHTYFLFPFSIDTETLKSNNPDLWTNNKRWIESLDAWMGKRVTEDASSLVKGLGPWRRDAYRRFDFDSDAYQNMVFFHLFMRRVFFDIETPSGSNGEGLLRCYTLPVPSESELYIQANDVHGLSTKSRVTDLRLFLFVNGMGILSIGVEAYDLPLNEVLWINESLRKIYPSSGQQVREGRIPSKMAFLLEKGSETIVLAEENFNEGKMSGVLPPLSKLITALLHFLDYSREEFEPVLDERMVVYSYIAVDRTNVSEDFHESEEYQILLSRLLYVEHSGNGYRYSPKFNRDSLDRQLYKRWAHQGTFYGFTSYSSVAVTLGRVHREVAPS